MPEIEGKEGEEGQVKDSLKHIHIKTKISRS
jgi:hypothetical protein